MKTEKNPSFFYDPAQFPALALLTQHFELIRNELIQKVQPLNQLNWLATFPNYVNAPSPQSWDVFTLLFFCMNHVKNQTISKETTQIIKQISSIISCDFSRMKANTQILPHRGYTRMVLRGHLPLIVPQGDLCGIKVGDEIAIHEEGKLILFDDSFEHSAWNNSDEDRIVLMFDIPNPLWGYSAEQISEFKINNIQDPFLLSIADQATWSKSFNEKCLPL